MARTAAELDRDANNHAIQASIGSATSTNNTTTTLLSSGATYTGTGEQNNYPQVAVYLFSNIAGTLNFEFSVDGVNWHTFPTAGFTVSASIPEFHTAVKLGRYFRVNFVMDSGTQTVFRLYTYYGNGFLPSNAPIGFTIGTDADAMVVKSVISGVGDTTAKVTDHKALQVTPPPEGKSAFGETIVAQAKPSVEVIFHNFVNPLTTVARANQSGTVTQANGMVSCSTGAAANSSGQLLSKDVVRYHPGQGVRSRFTALFTTGVANNTQLAGIGSAQCGLFFGYNGDTFGIMRREGGAPEIRTLTISAGADTSTGDDDITITLDGDATAITLTDFTGDATITANEIAAGDYSDVGRGWTACAVGATVVYVSWDASARTGTYSLVDTDATGAAGTFAQTLAGVAPTDTWTAQSAWSGDDLFDGNGLSGVTLDPTKGNVFQIVYQYLGFGGIEFYIEDPDDKEYHLVHTISYANQNTTPSLSEPSMALMLSSENTSNTTDIVVKSGSMAGFIDGQDGLIGQRRGTKANVTLGATTTETPFLTVRNTEVFQSALNRGEVKILIASASADHTKPVAVNFYANATLTGASFADLETGVSIVETDTSATAFSGGTFLFEIPLGKTGNAIVDISQDEFAGLLQPGDSITATVAPKSGNSAEATASLYFVELF